jgi:alanine racemase
MIDVTDIAGVVKGDVVTLIGRDGDQTISVEMLSKLSGRFYYEVTCDLGNRVPRRYIYR